MEAIIAAMIVAALFPLVRWFVRLNAGSWKVMDGRAKSHFISDFLWWPLVLTPFFIVIFLLSSAPPSLFVDSVIVDGGILAESLTLFSFLVLMTRVHERYNTTTLDTLVPMDYSWSRASFVATYKRMFNFVYRGLWKLAKSQFLL